MRQFEKVTFVCDCCGERKDILTNNHSFIETYEHCPSCYWHGGMSRGGKLYWPESFKGDGRGSSTGMNKRIFYKVQEQN